MTISFEFSSNATLINEFIALVVVLVVALLDWCISFSLDNWGILIRSHIYFFFSAVLGILFVVGLLIKLLGT